MVWAGIFDQSSGFVRANIGILGEHDDQEIPWWRVGGVFWERDLEIGKIIKINEKLFRVHDVTCTYISNQAAGVVPNQFQVTLEPI